MNNIKKILTELKESLEGQKCKRIQTISLDKLEGIIHEVGEDYVALRDNSTTDGSENITSIPFTAIICISQGCDFV